MPKVYKKWSDERKLKIKIANCKRYNRPIDDIERFWSYVDIKGFFDCWEWQGFIDKDGYGQFWLNGKIILAHRLAYELYYGAIPEGTQINHRCNNPKCCNPFQLYSGTQQDNMNDKVRVSRQAKGESHGMVKLTEKQVLEIRENKDNLSQRKLAKIFGIHQGQVWSIHNNKTWKHIPSS